MKSETSEFSITVLKNRSNQTEHWDGVRNYHARNFMRDKMRIGDRVLFYYSVVKPSVVGTVRVVKTAYPDFKAWDPKSKHFDPKSAPENSIWYYGRHLYGFRTRKHDAASQGNAPFNSACDR